LSKRGHCGDQQNGFGGLFRRSFYKIKADFEALNAKSTFKEQNVSYIPLSALTGDNVVESWRNALVPGQTILA
jgi:sulfate adenylyltransferase subunit 1 (EFTu-like GTPase family)